MNFVINRVSFRGDVAISVGGKWTTIGDWARSKHGEALDCELHEGGVYLWDKDAEGRRTGRRKNVPWSSISYLDESMVAPVKAKP